MYNQLEPNLPYSFPSESTAKCSDQSNPIHPSPSIRTRHHYTTFAHSRFQISHFPIALGLSSIVLCLIEIQANMQSFKTGRDIVHTL